MTDQQQQLPNTIAPEHVGACMATMWADEQPEVRIVPFWIDLCFTLVLAAQVLAFLYLTATWIR